MSKDFKDFKSDLKPVWCPGCGDFGVLSATQKAFASLDLDIKDICIVSGIGCSARFPAYLTSYGMHTLHGRALAYATGVKIANPDLSVLTVTGDGDCFSIGGNHFIHAARRNVDMTVLMFDNQIYGLTKGQQSPTTDSEYSTKMNPMGTGVSPVKPLNFAISAGASFVARAFSGDIKGLTDVITAGMEHKGFSFIQIMSPCITFVPEQKGWKGKMHPSEISVTDDPYQALFDLKDDDNFQTGIFLKTNFKEFNCKIDSNNMTDVNLLDKFAIK